MYIIKLTLKTRHYFFNLKLKKNVNSSATVRIIETKKNLLGGSSLSVDAGWAGFKSDKIVDLVTGKGSELSWMTKSEITCVRTCGLTMALGGPLSLTSSAVAATGMPFSGAGGPLWGGWVGAVPGIGAGWGFTGVSKPFVWAFGASISFGSTWATGVSGAKQNKVLLQ